MRRTILLIGVLLAGACREKSITTAPPDPLVGTYHLRSINGHAPPQIIEEDSSGAFSILSGQVVLNADKTFVDSTDVQLVTSNSVERTSDVGRGIWRAAGDSVFFRLGVGNEYGMELSGTELTQDFLGTILVYRR